MKKKSLSQRDICTKFITPGTHGASHAGPRLGKSIGRVNNALEDVEKEYAS
jgi:hypothetical protein